MLHKWLHIRYYAQINETAMNKCSQKLVKLTCCFGTAVRYIVKWTWCCVHHCVSHRLDDLNAVDAINFWMLQSCHIFWHQQPTHQCGSHNTAMLCSTTIRFCWITRRHHSFLCGRKKLLQSPQKIRIPFNFKEQSKPLQLPGNMWVHTEQCHVMNKGTTHYLWLYWQTSRCCISDGLTWQKTTWIWVSGYQFCCYYTLLYMHKTWCPACLSVYSRNIHRP